MDKYRCRNRIGPQPRTSAFPFFFFFDVLVKVRQLSTRCSRVSVRGRAMRIASRTRTKTHTFSPGIVHGLALLGRDFLFFLACLKTFIGEVHFDGSTIKHSVAKQLYFHRWQWTHLRLRTSSSISNSFDFCRSCVLKGGVRPLSLGWSSGVEVGKDISLSRVKRAWLIPASSSSRFEESPSSFSALNVEKD